MLRAFSSDSASCSWELRSPLPGSLGPANADLLGIEKRITLFWGGADSSLPTHDLYPNAHSGEGIAAHDGAGHGGHE
jgi:hypothetical protein